MGKSTKIKNEQRALKEAQIQNAINSYTKQSRAKQTASDKPLLSYIPADLHSLFQRKPCEFQVKTKSSNKSKQLLELVKFLYVKYPVPKLLDQVWNDDKKQDDTYKKWFVCIATGGSIHKEYLKSFLTKKESHLFLNCTRTDLTIRQAIVYAICKAEGASDGNAFRIAKSRLSERNYTLPFFQNCARFFSKNEPKSIDQLNDLMDFLMTKYQQDQNFNIFGQGYTINSLMVKMKDWHHQLRRAKELGSFSWQGLDVPDEQIEKINESGHNVLWKIQQVITSKELLTEGSEMHHCVYSYKNSCISGNCSIWSLRTLDSFGGFKRKVTLEIRNRRIVQARGFANRQIRNDERSVIKQWAFNNNIDF